mmetsp:Transcript_103938/g.318403  ORF Transcript_103938/g.318403 Transcript_103938/m.318403 type:complete len:174 (-) Transcript_103938:74-595(-)
MAAAMKLAAFAAAVLPAWQAAAGRLAGAGALAARVAGAGARREDVRGFYACGGVEATVEQRDDWDRVGHFWVQVSQQYLGGDGGNATTVDSISTELRRHLAGIRWDLTLASEAAYQFRGTGDAESTSEETMHMFAGLKQFVRDFAHEHRPRGPEHAIGDCDGDAPDEALPLAQ